MVWLVCRIMNVEAAMIVIRVSAIVAFFLFQLGFNIFYGTLSLFRFSKYIGCF